MPAARTAIPNKSVSFGVRVVLLVGRPLKIACSVVVLVGVDVVDLGLALGVGDEGECDQPVNLERAGGRLSSKGQLGPSVAVFIVGAVQNATGQPILCRTTDAAGVTHV